MTSRATLLTGARSGALVLAITVVVPVAVSAAVYGVLGAQPATDDETRFGFASLVLGIAAVASALGVAATFAFTLYRPAAAHGGGGGDSDRVLTLRTLAILRACADAGAFGVLYAPNLQVWQTSVALAIVEIIFFATLLRFAANVLDDHGVTSTARSARQFVYLYAAARASVILVWAFPDFTLLSMSHRALAPILDGVVAFVLLRAAGQLGKTRDAAPSASAPTPP